METFRLILVDNSPSRPKYCPLVVGLHGGSYTSQYFDATLSYTASLISNSLSILFVAIDRPGYNDSTPVTPIPEGYSFPEEWGTWLYKYILPTLWAEFGLPKECSCIVLHYYSLGANSAIVAAPLRAAASKTSTYALGGVVVSGFGSLFKETGGHTAHPNPPPSHINIPVHVKGSTLLLPGTADGQVYTQSQHLDHAMPFDEIASLRTDHYWDSTDEHLQDFAASFPRSDRIDTNIIRAALYNLELSYWAAGWYARSFRFAIECVASHLYWRNNITIC
ncbi:hypothetical protein EDB80DRAFT_750857 [Ilyonectria destructans]|nr:hypothetical protein EDB80DRAFT_750857 [Ilyonectria destructans]